MAGLDRAVASQFPETMRAIVTSVGRPDAEGRIGRNREWGNLYSVRFQYGAGRALRHATASNDQTLARVAMRVISAGLDSIDENGAFPARLPAHIAQNRQVETSDQASAAAFFLSDICPAMLTANISDSRLPTAMSWLSEHHATLAQRDRRAPNRLLISALAFAACGKLLDDPSIVALAEPLIDEALAFAQSDGVFEEAQGSDTSYQAVNLVAAIDILAMDAAGPHRMALEQAVTRGGNWLAMQIGPNGRLDSSGNTRTCANETFLGRHKEADLREVFRALAYGDRSEAFDVPRLSEYERWLATRPSPCSGD